MMRRLVAGVVGLAAVFALAVPASHACGSYGDIARMRNASIQGGAEWLWSLDYEGGTHRVAKAGRHAARGSDTLAQTTTGTPSVASR